MSRLATQLRQLSSSLPSGNGSGAAGSGSRNSSGSHSLSTAVHHPSLLFSPRVAADLDTESCHALALSGLTALSSRHSGFAVFSSSLFHPATVRLDRRAAKPEVQAALNRSITAFLSRLSAFFLLPAAQQCLEYCVRVYAVHELEAEAVLDMMLPYHDSLPFSRMLALLHIPSSLQRFRFLQPLQRGASTAAVPRSVLLSGCLQEPELFLRIAQSSRARPHSAQLGLYVSLGVELLQRDDLSDALLSSLLPLLMDGLNLAAHHQPEYQAASLLLLTALTRRTVLQEEVMLAVLRALLSSLSRDTASLRSTVCLLQSLCGSQQLSRLPSAVLLLCCPHAKSLVSEIRSLMAERDCDALVVLLLSSAAAALVQPALSAAQPSEQLPAAAGQAQSLLPFLRLLLQSLPVTSRHLLPALDAAFDAAVQAAAATRKEAAEQQLQLPARVVALLKEILAAVEAVSGEDAERWLQQQSQKQRQRQRGDPQQQEQPQEADNQARKRRRKGEQRAEGESEEADDEEGAAPLQQQQPDARDGEEATGGAKKRRRHRDRRAVVALPGSSAASALLLELTRGSRHALPGESEEGGDGALQSVQRLKSGDDEQQKRALTALQRLQREQQLQADSAQVEAAVLDCFLYARAGVVLHLLSLSQLLLSLPVASLQPQLTRLLAEHSASAAADSRSIVTSALSFLSTQLLPAHPDLVDSFLPILLHLCWMRAEQPSLSLSHRVRLLLPELHRLCSPSAACSPLLQDLPLPEADASSSDSSLAVGEDNERLVEALASNSLRDASDGCLQTLLLAMDDPLQPQWISGLTLLRLYKLRRAKATRRQAAEAADLQLLHRLFAAALRAYGRLSASSDSTAHPTPSGSSAASSSLSVTSFSSASDSAWPEFLRFFLDRLLACCPRLPEAAARELFISLVSAAPSLQPQLSTLLSRHLSASASSAVAFLTPLIVPLPSAASVSARLPVAAQVASLQLLCGLSPAAEATTVIPLLLSAACSSSKAARLVAIRAAVSCGDSEAYSALLSKLSAAATECVTDAAYCQQLLRSGLSVSSSASRSLMQAAIAAQHPPLRLALLSLLQDSATPQLFHLAAPLLSSLLSAASVSQSSPFSPAAAGDDEQVNLSVLSLLMRRLTAEVASSSAEAAQRTGRLLLLALSSPLSGPPLLALDQLMQHAALLPALPSAMQSELEQAVIALGLSSSAARLRASEAVSRLRIPSSAFIGRLTAALDSGGGADSVAQALTSVLELMTAEQADTRSASPPLLQTLMSALSRLSQPQPGSGSEADALLYCRQLLLIAARQAAEALRQQAAADSMQEEELSLNLPLLVSLLQPPPSSSPAAVAVRNAAFALLPSLAALLPSGALQAVSAPLLQHLFASPIAEEQLLLRCLETVVPSLLPPPAPATSSASLPPLAWSLLSAAIGSAALTAASAASVLQLLSALVRTVSPLSLYAAVALLLSRRLREEQQREGEKQHSDGLDLSQFISALLSNFRAEEQLEALQALLSLTLQAASAAPLSSPSPASEALGMNGWSAADSLRWQEAALRLVSDQLQSLPFVSLLLDLAAEQQAAVNAAFSRLLLQLIAHRQRLSQLSGAAAAAASSLLPPLSAALHRLMELQTVDGVVALSQRLLTVSDGVEQEATQRAALLQLLQERLAAMAAAVSRPKQQELDALTALAAPLQSVVDAASSSSVSASRDVLRACQLSVSCLQTLLTLACGSPQPASPSPQQVASLASRRERLLPAFDSVLRLLQLPRVAASAPLTASCLVCIASGVDALQLPVLSRLPQFVPAALSVLSRGSAGATVDAAALSVLGSSVRQLSRFLTPQLSAILSAFMQPRFHGPAADALCRQTIADSVKELTALLPAESLLPLLRSSYRAAVATGSAASLQFVLSLLAQVVAQLSVSGFSSNLPAVFRLYLRAFELRQRRPDFEQLDSLETEAIASFLTFVLRMTEAQLKTCWQQLQDWLLQPEPASSSPSPSRQLPFFKLAAALSGRLQSIFVPHFLQSFEQAVEVLTAAGQQAEAEDGEMQQQLTAAVLQSLRLSLSQDSAHLYGKDHLQLLLPPLLQSVPAAAGRLDSSSFHSFVSTAFVPLCSQLALSLSQLRLWQPLHLGLLSLTRSTQAAEVRAAAWQTVTQLFTDVGSRYLVLLPETLPFIAEAQEDEETEVEDRLREAVGVIESMTGEKIDRYIT